MCKKIHRGGNAEKYYADKKYKEAVAVAVEASAADMKEAPESVPTTDILVRLSKINFNYAICLWKYHFYGYDSYRDDLRNSIEILEHFFTYPDAHRPAGVDDALICIRNEQLDWCIHDLTPATFEAYRDS